MLPSLVLKTFRDWRRTLIGWALGLAAFASVYVGAWASVKDSPDLLRLKAESMPKGLSATFGVTDLTNASGYLQGTVFTLVGPLLLSMVAIVLGARAVAGPEDRHVMDLFLANPISRRGFVAQRGAALLLSVLGLGAVIWLVTLGLSRAVGMTVGVDRITAASIGLLLLALLFGALALAVGAVTGKRATSLGIAGGVAVASYALHGLSQNVSWLHGWRWLTPFHYYLGADPLHQGFNWPYLAVLALAAAVAGGLALYAFDRRDIRV